MAVRHLLACDNDGDGRYGGSGGNAHAGQAELRFPWRRGCRRRPGLDADEGSWEDDVIMWVSGLYELLRGTRVSPLR